MTTSSPQLSHNDLFTRFPWADGVHVGTVDHLEGERIKMAKSDSVDGKHRYLPAGLVATVEGDTIRLSATGATAVDLFEEAE